MRYNSQGKFMWPGYGENCRVLDWILRRIDEETGTARPTPVGYVPTQEAFNTEGLKVDYDGLFSVPIDFWTEEVSVLVIDSLITIIYWLIKIIPEKIYSYLYKST